MNQKRHWQAQKIKNDILNAAKPASEQRGLKQSKVVWRGI